MSELALSVQDEMLAILADPGLVEESRQLRLQGDPGTLPVYKALGKASLLAPHWPVEYGGRGLPVSCKAFLTRQLILHGHPDLAHVVAVDIVGQTILDYGTSGMRSRYLPGLAAGDLLAAVLYTEPGAGSDMAEMLTVAEPVDVGWSLHGRKTYSLKAHKADVAILAARTAKGDSKFYGISLFVVPLSAPGIHVGHIPSLSDDHFSDVIVEGTVARPDDVLGEIDNGWELLGKVLPIERTGIEFETKCELVLRHLQGHVPERHVKELQDLQMRHSASRTLAARCLESVAQGRVNERDTAVSKLVATELHRDITLFAYSSVAPEVLGPLARADLDREHRDTPGYTLSAGTSEMMMQLILSDLLNDSEAERAASSPHPLDDVLEDLASMESRGGTGVLTRLESDDDVELLDEVSCLISETLVEPPTWFQRVRLARKIGGLNFGPRLLEPLMASLIATGGRNFVWRHGGNSEPVLFRALSSPPLGQTTVALEVLGEGKSRVTVGSVSSVEVSGRCAARLVTMDTAAAAQNSGLGVDAILAAYLVGLHDRAFHLTRAYIQQRKQFAAPLASFQGVSFPFVRSFVDLTVSEVLLEQMTNGRAPMGAQDERLSFIAQKTLANVTQCLHAHGARGMRSDNEMSVLFTRCSVVASFCASSA